jgi:hypothetical protein
MKISIKNSRERLNTNLFEINNGTDAADELKLKR